MKAIITRLGRDKAGRNLWPPHVRALSGDRDGKMLAEVASADQPNTRAVTDVEAAAWIAILEQDAAALRAAEPPRRAPPPPPPTLEERLAAVEAKVGL